MPLTPFDWISPLIGIANEVRGQPSINLTECGGGMRGYEIKRLLAKHGCGSGLLIEGEGDDVWLYVDDAEKALGILQRYGKGQASEPVRAARQGKLDDSRTWDLSWLEK